MGSLQFGHQRRGQRSQPPVYCVTAPSVSYTRIHAEKRVWPSQHQKPSGRRLKACPATGEISVDEEPQLPVFRGVTDETYLARSQRAIYVRHHAKQHPILEL